MTDIDVNISIAYSRCEECGQGFTTQDALAGQVVEDDEGMHHRECMDDELPSRGHVVHDGIAAMTMRPLSHHERLLAGGFADGRTARRHANMDRHDG